MSFIIEEYFGLIIGLIVGFLFAQFYKSQKDNITQKIDNSQKQVFSREEYENYTEIAKKVLNNTTISFKSDTLNREELEMNLYYRTILVGNKIIQSNGCRISDVGEI